MSIAVMTSSTVLANATASNVSSSLRNFNRFSEARLQEELSSDMYSEHGLDAVIRPVSGLVCQSLMVSSYWMPGSAHCQAASAILRHSSRASMVSRTSPVARAFSPNSVPCSTARMNSSVTRTELLAFWYCTEVMSLPPRSMSKPASRKARILFSSLALVSMNSSMSGWSTSSTTILAARRVAPPDLMVPALASAPRMKETGPEAVPPELSSSFDDRIRDRFSPAPEPPLKMKPSSRYQFRMESIESSTERMKQALTCCGDAVPTLNQTGELNEKYWCSNIQVSSCSKTSASSGLAKDLLPRRGTEGAPEVLGRHDRRGVDAPEVRELHPLLLEHHLAGLPVGLHDVTALPGHLGVRVYAAGEDSLHGQAGWFAWGPPGLRSTVCRTGGLGHVCLSRWRRAR